MKNGCSHLILHVLRDIWIIICNYIILSIYCSTLAYCWYDTDVGAPRAIFDANGKFEYIFSSYGGKVMNSQSCRFWVTIPWVGWAGWGGGFLPGLTLVPGRAALFSPGSGNSNPWAFKELISSCARALSCFCLAVNSLPSAFNLSFRSFSFCFFFSFRSFSNRI